MTRLEQHWERYTREDHDVWKILFERQIANLQDKAWTSYLECVNRAGLTRNEVPRFTDIDRRLLDLTGWQVEVVKGIIPVKDFIQLLHARQFCSSTWLRQRHQLDYIEEPDMFHDTFGHIPLLADRTYSAFVSKFAELGMKFIDDAVLLRLLSRIYWFTIEFGLMRENGGLRIYGAGIISSFGESKHVYTDGVKLRPFDIREVLRTPFRTDEMQHLYYVVDDMSDLWNCLVEAERFLVEAKDGRIPLSELRLDEQTDATEAEDVDQEKQQS